MSVSPYTTGSKELHYKLSMPISAIAKPRESNNSKSIPMIQATTG
uniref:Uncharacterized protein n=1 Tax=Utricularia reniformis TaxID=192314 RepID=A0A1Y0B223_9LAMI|nr:hypothetical protein AEK19_MT1288 [Utricularia reniformis]ART31492.1 hypothetical protein AEK19_MT1288 [Utricularia reniformis]